MHIALTVQSPQHLSTIIKAFELMYIQEHEHAFKPIDILGSMCVHICVDIKHGNINTCKHAIIRAFEHRSR